MNESACIIFGAGGHAAVVIELLMMHGPDRRYLILDPNPERWGTTVFGVPVIGGDSLVPQLRSQGAAEFVVGIGSADDCAVRARVFEQALSMGLKPLTLVHPAACRAKSAEVGAGSQLLAGSVVSVRARLGRNVIVNTGAIVEHDSVLGDHVHVATGAKLGGEVAVGTGAHIGIGASVRQQIVIGGWAVVGAGAVVVRDVPDGMVVVGNPARPLERSVFSTEKG